MAQSILWRILEIFTKKEKIKGYTNKRMNVIDRLFEATGISQRYLRNIHTEFLAYDRKFQSPINRYTASRIRIIQILSIGKRYEGWCMTSTLKRNIQYYQLF